MLACVMASSSVVAVSLKWKASMEAAAAPLDALSSDTSHCQACLSTKHLRFDSLSLKGRYTKHQHLYESSRKRITRVANSRKSSGNGKLTRTTPRKQHSGSSKWVSTDVQERHEEASIDSRVAGSGNVKKMQGEEHIEEKHAGESNSKLIITEKSEENQQMQLSYSLLAKEQNLTDAIQNDVPGEELEKITYTIDATENDASSEELETSTDTFLATERDIPEEDVDSTSQNHLALLENIEKQVDVGGAFAEKREKEVFLEEDRIHLAQIEAQKLDFLKLVEANSFTGNKVFFYPQPVRAGSEVQIFLNRSITVLVNQPRIIMMGAFNDWRWIPFSIEMQKSDLPGDWWVCSVQVPREVYKIDFVFFDGGNIYENNATKDFFVLVEGGMMKGEFEDFLIEEKRKEAERLAAEQAEKEHIAAEERKQAEEKAAEEADKAEAVRLVKEQREREQLALHKAVKNMEGIWKLEPSNFCAGGTVSLFYNRSSGPLAFSKDIWIHGGYNNWQESVSIVKKLSPAQFEVGDWWYVEVYVQERAYMLNWVFADGPPNSAKLYDNNNYQDFHALVPRNMPEDLYWAIVEDEVYKNLRHKRQEQEKAEKKKAEHRERMKLEMKAKSKQAFLKSQAHVFYTDPIDVKAGEKVDVFYNPSSTILKGRTEIWMRYSFNRWTHRLGVLPPLKMIATGHGTHLKACVSVPQDAYVMDFVFSERGDMEGGIYDNRNGLDYHIPINGGTIKEPPLNIVHIAAEMAPIAKVGGLGDVVTSLSRAVQELGHNVEVVLPKYDCLDYKYIHDLTEESHFNLGATRLKVWNGKVEGLNVHFLEPENGMFWVGCVYGRKDDAARFDFFCRASLEFLLRRGQNPDIIHCHDWTSAPVAWLFQESYKHYGLSKTRIVFTIHNFEFGTSMIGKAMQHANKATTVSQTYAVEISGNPAIAPHLHKFHGIRNGIDPDIWDPYCDSFIPMNYTAENVIEGKKASKQQLQHRLGLQEVDRPLVGVITRLTAQKGIHLVKHAIWRILEHGGQFVLLGSAPDPRVQNEFLNLANQLKASHADMARLCLTYDEPLSHLIYAGADFILIPSIFEPCGLTQLIAMRYGAIPIVRRTGGLRDTVYDVDHDRDRAREDGLVPNGFSFDGTDTHGVDYALNRALSSWYEAHNWIHQLCKQVMEQDWTWNRPALDYIELYYGAKK